MAKQSGLGSNFYIAGNDLSGDVSALDTISGGPVTLDVTSIKSSANERIGGVRSGDLQFSSWFNTAAGAEHPVLDALPRTDVICAALIGVGKGKPAACVTGKQLNYDGTRGADGSMSFKIEVQSNAFGLEWGLQLTDNGSGGIRTDTAATNGASLDTTASVSFGGQAYLQVLGFTGTDVTVKIQDSADNSTFADVSGFGFTAVTTAHVAQRIALGSSATLRRYVRVVTTTSGGFTSAKFSVVMVKNLQAVAF